MHAKMKSLNTQLRKKGLEMVLEEVDPTFGPVYTIQPVRAKLTNSAVAYRMYYLGEVQKWSAARRKAIQKASNRIKKEKLAAEERERSMSSSTTSTTPASSVK